MDKSTAAETGISTRAVHAAEPDPVPGAPLISPLYPSARIYDLDQALERA